MKTASNPLPPYLRRSCAQPWMACTYPSLYSSIAMHVFVCAWLLSKHRRSKQAFFLQSGISPKHSVSSPSPRFFHGEPSAASDSIDLANFPWLPAAPDPVRIACDTQDNITKELNLTIAAKILGSTIYENKFVRDAALLVWECKGHVYMRQYTKFVFSFVFSDISDKIKVLAGCPWTIGWDSMVVKDTVDDIAIKNTEFIWSNIWVRVYDLPPKGYTIKTTECVGNAFGGLVAFDTPMVNDNSNQLTQMNQYLLKNFLRVQVTFDIRKPLYHEIPLEVELTDKSIVRQIAKVAYEALPECCFLCGTLGHTFKFCNHYNGSWTINQLPYSESLRATRITPNILRSFRNGPRVSRIINKPPLPKVSPKTTINTSPDKKKQKLVSKISPPKSSSPTSQPILLEKPQTQKSPTPVVCKTSANSACPMHHSFLSPHPYTIESKGSGSMTHQNQAPQPNLNMLFHQFHSPMQSFTTPFQQIYQHPNPYLQFGSFSHNAWPQNLSFPEGITSIGQANNQGPLVGIPVPQQFAQVASPTPSEPHAMNDINSLRNIINGKGGYFAPIQKDSPISVTKKKNKKKKSPIVEAHSETGAKGKPGVSTHVRTRSAGKRILNED